MQPDPVADQPRGEKVALGHLADQEDAGDDGDAHPVVELHEGQADRADQSDGGADEGHERQEAGQQADHQAEIQAGDGQPYRIVGAEDEADAELAPHPARECPVDQGGLLAHHPDRASRQTVVHPGNDPVPVAQQIETHDRCDEDQRQEVGQRHAPGHQAGQKAGDPAGHLAAGVCKGVANACHDFRRQPRFERGKRVRQMSAQALDVSRQALDQAGELTDHDRQKQQEGEHQNGDEDQGHQTGRQGAREARPLEPVAHRIEQIGHGHPGHEGQ